MVRMYINVSSVYSALALCNDAVIAVIKELALLWCIECVFTVVYGLGGLGVISWCVHGLALTNCYISGGVCWHI